MTSLQLRMGRASPPLRYFFCLDQVFVGSPYKIIAFTHGKSFLFDANFS
jgi:hypothetical protein